MEEWRSGREGGDRGEGIRLLEMFFVRGVFEPDRDLADMLPSFSLSFSFSLVCFPSASVLSHLMIHINIIYRGGKEEKNRGK